ncbi:sensor histidine kinase [Fictibacillus phosphorivorans]|uniref:sensor histidine kinase n=1 Tax=Fictibacillus phosphorivorans TaxID=1221500 RepID=UPI00203D5C73|nr:HAMP domain-containing sensor histidine kinase [Fictibacillus phosphorivorans]MCM3719538.1 HAMP domain-containing histidine kinase [Fictibacillus phosphorivorans]MCM3777229.1 HAMP domain-containing histidine kinase [Fictibacillus phosphorivorans]
MKLIKFVKRIGSVIAVSIILLSAWSLAYLLTTLLYTEIHYFPNEITRQHINSFFGLCLFVCFMFLLTRNPWIRSKQNEHLSPIIQAMKMIAEGNFNVDLSFYTSRFRERDKHHPYYQIVENMKLMATKLGEMEEMRQEFISNVSHEIQSPLTSISGFAHALQNEELSPEERRHYLEIIEMESLRLSKLSENLLKLTSLESEHLSLERKNYRLDHQLRRIILANEPLWAEKDINMDISLDHVMITADEELMDQVWINIIHNSIKFTQQRGTISITAYTLEDGSVQVMIRDTGIGMEKDTIMHIFERFYKADQSRNRKSGGNGLGLSIVKKIIDLHKGEIRVQSEVGKGTAITVTLSGNIQGER